LRDKGVTASNFFREFASHSTTMILLLKICVGIGIGLAMIAVFVTCVVGLAVWLAGSRLAREH